MTAARAHVFVSGRVQGVFFRQSTQLEAERLGVRGFVRNLHDGRVEAVFEGEETEVCTMVDYCRHGPKAAKVTNLEVINEGYKGEFSSFNAY